MSDLIKKARFEVTSILDSAVRSLMEEGKLPEAEIPTYSVEIPADKSHGDFAANIAMVSAKTLRQPPRTIAQLISEKVHLSGTYFERCEVAGPGFLNFFIGRTWFSDAILDVLRESDHFGRSDFGKDKKVMVEFVSANPTGPMHMGNARGGAIGDCLAETMKWAGFDVTREFYVNDAGNQIEKFGLSLEARYLQLYRGEDAVLFPEDGYHGDDIRESAKAFSELYGDRYLDSEPGDRQQALIDYALPKNIDKLRSDLEKYRIYYDVWFLESSLHKSGSIGRIIEMLGKKGLTYESEGALWYKASEFGSDKDEVLIRANGHPTYFAADIAYHYNKFIERQFEKVVNIWGADHHGHVARLKGAMDALDIGGERLDIVLMQLVRLTQNGEIVRMSKRTGKLITLSDLLDEVPVDAARFFFNMRDPSSHLDFDLGLAVEQSSQNPVYYVQYAHARICSILRTLESEGISYLIPTEQQLELLTQPEEIELIRHLAGFTGTVVSAAVEYDPALITRYSIDLATLFHKFYNACRVKESQRDLMIARLSLCIAVKHVIRNSLSILKIEAPDQM